MSLEGANIDPYMQSDMKIMPTLTDVDNYDKSSVSRSNAASNTFTCRITKRVISTTNPHSIKPMMQQPLRVLLDRAHKYKLFSWKPITDMDRTLKS